MFLIICLYVHNCICFYIICVCIYSIYIVEKLETKSEKCLKLSNINIMKLIIYEIFTGEIKSKVYLRF